MNVFSLSVRQRLNSWSSRVFVAAIVCAILAYGSVAEAPFYLSTIALALLAGASLLRPITSAAIGRICAIATLLLALLLLYVVLQTLPQVGRWFANEAWKSVNDLVAPVGGSISVAPGITLDALPRLALPLLVFLSALALFQGDAEGLVLWRSLAYFGVGYAAFGILQDLFLPEQILFAQKKFYVGNLTASFVNRNTAGTFFGVALMLNLGLLFHYLRRIHVPSFVEKVAVLDIDWGDENVQALIHALFCLIVAVALFLTQSRGAVGATFVGAVAGATFMAMRPLTADGPNQRPSVWRRYAAIFAGIVAIVGLFALFAGRSLYRMQEGGAEDGRWCAFASTIQAIRDHPIFGTGFGTFQDVFPAYRNSECAGIQGTWDRAHNFFLEGYLGLGLPFALAVLVGYGVLIGLAIHGARNRHRLRFVPVMGLATLILVTLHSLVDFSLQIPGMNVYFAAMMASTVNISLGGGSRARTPRA